MVTAAGLGVLVAVIVTVATMLVVRGRRDLGPLGPAVLALVGGVVGAELGFTLLGRSTTHGWWQPWTVLGAAVGAVALVLVRLSWRARVADAAVPSDPPAALRGASTTSLLVVLVAVAVRVRHRGAAEVR